MATTLIGIKAKRRQREPHLQDSESAKRALCATIFSDPACVCGAISHEITGRFVIDPHRHDDLLQLDLIDGCDGEATVNGRRVAIRGTTLLVTYPGDLHGYTLLPGRPPSEVCLFKVRVDDAWKITTDRPLPEVLTGLPRFEQLSEMIRAFLGDWTQKGVGGVALAHLAHAICLWPTSAAELGQMPQAAAAGAGADTASARVRRAVELLGRRYHDPPSLEELAEAASLSPRHFARRFQQDFGCTPHEFVSARRLDAARSLLLRTELQVSNVADELGFSSPAAFSRWFTRVAGQSPKQFRAGPDAF